MQSWSSPAVGEGAAHAAIITRALRVIGLFVFAVWVWRHMHDPFGLVHGSLLIFHEAGHVLFMPLGEFMMVLGGSLFQLMVPGLFVAYFALRRDWYAVAFAGLYLAGSLADVSVYIADARAGELPLLGGERSNHDWTFLLIEMNALDHDTLIGAYVRDVAVLLFWICAVAGAWLGWAGAAVATRPTPEDRAREGVAPRA